MLKGRSCWKICKGIRCTKWSERDKGANFLLWEQIEMKILLDEIKLKQIW